MAGRPRARLFGGFQLWRASGQIARLPTRRAALILAECLIGEHPVSRSQIVEEFWPETPPEKSRVSLRTALSQLRAALGPSVILNDGQFLYVDRNALDCDLLRARQIHRQCEAAGPGAKKRALLEELALLAQSGFMPGFDSESVELERELWVEVGKSCWRELAESQAESGMWKEALKSAQSALDMDQFDEQSLVLAMRLAAESGDPDRAIRIGQRASRAFKDALGIPPPRQVIQLASEVKTGKITPNPRSQMFAEPGEKSLLATIVASALAKDPESVFEMVCAESLNPSCVHHMQEYLSILEQVLGATEGFSEGRLLTARTAARTAGLLNDHARTLRWGGFVIDATPEDNPMHVAMLSFVGYVYVELRDLDRAREYFQLANKLAHANGLELDITSTTMMLASISLSEMKTDGVRADMNASIARAEAEFVSPYRLSQFYIHRMVYFIVTSDIESAMRDASRISELLDGAEPFYGTGLAVSLQAFAESHLGRHREALASAAAGVESAVALNSNLAAFRCMECAAVVLARAGSETSAVWVVDSLETLRESQKHPRLPIDQDLIRDDRLSHDPKVIARARQSNRLNGQPMDTVAEFLLEEIRLARRNCL
ncbi:MAG: hypothetical protein JSS71_01795 [Armatimonadetes bacterium]|nr:hypothetical protein [Armatimonadota bacterium]MBX3108111.1 hypothetical protein [Fimbriimonadaceae bacterium]